MMSESHSQEEAERSLITEFYSAFQAKDAKRMAACYHENVTFQDPGFGVVKGEMAGKMWEMLLSRGGENLVVKFSDVTNDSAHWEAEYLFGPQKRFVRNKISAKFTFQDGKIYTHKDTFDFWKWSSQALGTPGVLFGWMSCFRNKVQQKSRALLERYVSKT